MKILWSGRIEILFKYRYGDVLSALIYFSGVHVQT